MTWPGGREPGGDGHLLHLADDDRAQDHARVAPLRHLGVRSAQRKVRNRRHPRGDVRETCPIPAALMNGAGQFYDLIFFVCLGHHRVDVDDDPGALLLPAVGDSVGPPF